MAQSSEPSAAGDRTTPIEVLVMGDWVVDENWVLARHRSDLSTMEGKAHLRALGDAQSRLITFCGAGRVARFLYWGNRYPEQAPHGSNHSGWIPPTDRTDATFSIVGLGTWAVEDEPKLYRMFYPRYSDGINPFTLTRTPRHVPYGCLDGLYLCNLAAACSPAGSVNGLDIGTTRIYRLYNLQAETPGGLVLDRRVDFELRYLASEKEGGRQYDEVGLADILSKLRSISMDSGQFGFKIWKEHALQHLRRLEERLLAEAGQKGIRLERTFEQLRNEISSLKVRKNAGPDGDRARSEHRRRPFRYALIKDLGKGTVTPTLIEGLQKEGLINEETQWFISSKQLNPRYLGVLGRSDVGSIRLLFLPPMAVAQMEHERLPNRFVQKWFASGPEPAKEGLDRLERFWKDHATRGLQGRRKFPPPPLFVVAMPKGLSVIGVEGRAIDDLVGYCQPKAVLDEIDEELTGRASMFFAALSAQMIRQDRELREEACPAHDSDDGRKIRAEAVEVALKASHDLVLGNINALKGFGSERRSDQPEFSYDLSFARYRRNSVSSSFQPVSPVEQQVVSFTWATRKNLWEQARRDAGIICIGDPPRYCLELWRAMGELDGYIETVERRRRDIAQLLSSLKEFLHDNRRSSFSAMLIAQPGSGKSYLAAKVAAASNMPLLNFNVTQLVTRENIGACFSAIASAQAQDRKRTHLVFFDEINASVGESTVYDQFLTVLDEGTFLRGGQLFKLDPCVWLFAGTTTLDASMAGYSTKEADFKSRLTIPEIRLDVRGEDTDERRSLIYQGALQIQLQHTDVKKISAEVLKAFACLDITKTNSREIKKLAGRFRNIQYGEVRKKNLPEDLQNSLREHGVARDTEFRSLLREDEHRSLDDILVEIKRQPDGQDYGDSYVIPPSRGAY